MVPLWPGERERRREMATYDIITVGSNLIDIFVLTGLPELLRKGEKFIGYPAGEKIRVRETRMATGGGGTNTAAAFARLGLRTGYLGNVSTDHFGESIMKELAEEGVSFLGTRSSHPCGYSVILDSKEHHRTILVYKGASDELDLRAKDLKALDTGWLYFSSSGKRSFGSQKRLARHAKRRGIKLAYNPSIYQVQQGRERLMPLLERTEVLVLNKEEAETLAGTKERPWKALARLGPKMVCITDEERPVRLYTEGALYTAWPHAVRVKEATGAGDAFAATFVTGLIRKESIERCLQLALANSESVITHIGAKHKLLTLGEALAAVRRAPARVEMGR